MASKKFIDVEKYMSRSPDDLKRMASFLAILVFLNVINWDDAKSSMSIFEGFSQ